jgi:hypothetical protein
MTKQALPQETQVSTPIEPRFEAEHEACRVSQYDIGIAKYGIPLMTFNGRSAHTDAMQEYIDLGRYMTQMQMEREVIEERLRECRAFLKTLVLPFSRQHELFEMVDRLNQVLQSR